MFFKFSIQTKDFITKKSKFFKIMNYFVKMLYPNTALGFLILLYMHMRLSRTHNVFINYY